MVYIYHISYVLDYKYTYIESSAKSTADDPYNTYVHEFINGNMKLEIELINQFQIH